MKSVYRFMLVDRHMILTKLQTEQLSDCQNNITSQKRIKILKKSHSVSDAFITSTVLLPVMQKYQIISSILLSKSNH